jgi:hypothetical protein
MEARDAPLRGRPLRRAAVVVLLRAHQPLTVGAIQATIERDGRLVAGPAAGKRLADALGYEARRGWVVRVERGTYAVGRVSRSSQWRLLNRPD